MPAESRAASETFDVRPGVLQVLLFEDDAVDESCVRKQLAKDGLASRVTCARTLAEFSQACERGGFDIILAQFRLPAWDSRRSLELARLNKPEVPFIFLSSVGGEELAVECMQEGATDYVLIEKITRLGPAIQRALSRDRSGGMAVGEHEHVFRQISQNTRDIICLLAPDLTVTFVSPSVRTLLGYQTYEWIGRRPVDFAHPGDLARMSGDVKAGIADGAATSRVISRFRHKDGHHVWLEMIIEPIRNQVGELVEFMSIARDFTERHDTEEAILRGERLFEGIAEANRLLLTTTDVTKSLRPVLRALGEAAAAERVAVFELRSPGQVGRFVASLRAEWTSKAEYSLFSDPRLLEVRLDGLDAGDLPRRFGEGEAVILDAKEASPAVRQTMSQLGIVSMMAFPIVVGGETWGGMVFHQCSRGRLWQPTERSALAVVASTLGRVIDREKALAALAASERQYEALLESLSEAVFQIDREARWQILNPTWEEISGYTVAESIGRRFSEFLADETAAEALEGIGRLVSGRDERVETEVCFKHRDGSELWLRVIARPQEGPDGRIAGVAGTLVDVTQRRLAQDALRASERKFAAVFASASDALFLVDRESNRIVECNPRAAEMFECADSGQLVGTDGNFLRRSPLAAAQVNEVDTTINAGVTWTREAEYVTRGGRIFWGQVAISRMEPASLGTVLVRVTDITELKQSEERLRASLGEKEVLLKEVYHRVKNNLQIISALLRMQSRRVKDKVAMEALENSISRVMAMSMVHEKLYQAQNLVSIDFVSFAQSLVGFLNQLTVGLNIRVVINVTGESLALSIDQAIPLGLILNELVTNSLKYAFPEGTGGRVTIEVETTPADQAKVVVADDGVGLAGDDIPDSSTGLGFRIVRMLVEQLHGALEIKSGNGLRVAVVVPLPERRLVAGLS